MTRGEGEGKDEGSQVGRTAATGDRIGTTVTESRSWRVEGREGGNVAGVERRWVTELSDEEERGTGENEREREEGTAETTNGTEARLSVFRFLH